MKIATNEITNEVKEMFSYCQTCSHEWEEHFEKGCTRDYCSCPMYQKEIKDD